MMLVIEFFIIKVMVNHMMVIFSKNFNRTFCNGVVKTFLVRMGENDENIHAKNLIRGTERSQKGTFPNEIIAVDAEQNAFKDNKLVKIFARSGAFWFVMENSGPFYDTLQPLTQVQ